MEWNEKSMRCTNREERIRWKRGSNTPAALTSSPPSGGSFTAPAALVLVLGDTLADELAGAVAEGDATDEGVKLGNDRDVGLDAAAQSSTSTSAETTSEGQAIRGHRRGLLPDTLGRRKTGG
ncbi:hypothetical protein C8R44DRAFT_880161 [Mycena epipterygia]|nr:hypothetical protein C8R44DRAFT_880161 [Mycena epipterygia]